MFVLYVLGIQYQRASLPGWVRAFCGLLAFVALILDALLNWSLFSLYYWQWPKLGTMGSKTEWTFSDRLNNLCPVPSWRGAVALAISRVLNVFSPDHNHIPNAVGR